MSKEKIRKVDLSGLPRWTDGTYRGKIKWNDSVGYKIPFVYDDIEGEFLVVNNTNEKYIEISYNNNIYKIAKTCIKNANLGKIIGKFTGDFRYEIGKIINGLKIIGRYKENTNRSDGKIEVRKRYSYKCIKCGNEDTMDEHNLRKGYGCNVCCNSKIKVGINDVATTAPWMIDYFVDKEDAKRYSKRSDKKAKFKCLECGEEKEVSISNMYRDGHFKCPICGDGIKYPEKFMYTLLKQLNIEFIYQPSSATFNWCRNRRYDFYIPKYSMIIETHGIQHYEESQRGRSLKEEQENDRLKEQLAKDNGIEHYIVIDCRYSELEWIKNSILNSELNELLDLSKVDWLKCKEFSLKTLIKQVCDYWNQKEEWETTKDLSKIYKIHQATVSRYLAKGLDLGWCDYNAEEEKIKILNKKKKRVAVFRNDEYLYKAESIKELSNQSEDLFNIKLTMKGISWVCSGKIKSYKGYTFKYM